MDQTQLQEQIALYYSRLPKNMQELFSSMRWMDTLKNISIKFGLSENQKEVLGTETTLVLLGITHPEEYEDNLRSELGMTNDSLNKMIEEISTSVINTIRPQLNDAYSAHVKSLVEEKYGKMEDMDKKFNKLPKSVQVAISESNYQEVLYGIANTNKLSIEQMSALEEVTVKVLLGIIHPDQYESELSAKIALPAGKVSEIVTEVNNKVLKAIREILKKHWSDGEEKPASIDDEVPIPPYAVSIPEMKVEEPVRTPDSSIWQKGPAPVKESVPTPVIFPKTEPSIYERAGIEIVESPDMIGDKLKGITISKSVVSNHSLPKVGSPAPQAPAPAPINNPDQPKKHDPYHEAIE